MPIYKISVKRGKREGELTYKGSINLSTKCWWDLRRKIPARTYNRCSATTMKTKRNTAGNPREAIFIPTVPGYSGIFIHMGRNSRWSDGCIVIKENELKKIYDDIKPKDGRNVTVEVTDT
jgi:hypothetical protein